MSSILSRTYSNGGTDTKLVLQNSNVARPHGISTWNQIRLGIRYQFGLNATAVSLAAGTGSTWNIPSNPMFALGFCSGTSPGSMFLDNSTQHFVGVSTTGDFAFGNNLGSPQYFYTYNALATKRVGQVLTYDSNSTANWGVGLSALELSRAMFCVDLIKGSPNYTINAFSHVGSNAAWTDPLLSDLQTIMEQPTPGFSFYQTVSGTLPVNEAVNGTLDSITIAWGRAFETIEISDIIVARIQ